MVAALAAAALSPAPAAAHPGDALLRREPANPLNDLYALGYGGGQTITPVLRVLREEPPSVATPRAACDADSRPEPGIQGRVPEGMNPEGLDCNLEVLAHQGRSGGFRVHRYVDEQGRECAFYDTTLLFPSNAFRLSGESLGVAVVDMSNPAKPVQTDTLTTIPMLSPHESLSVNQKRGLIAA